MSELQAERIWRRDYFQIAPIKAGRLRRTPFVIGFDSEAEDGYPFMMQFSLPETSEEQTRLIHVSRRRNAGLHAFMQVVHRVCTSRKREYLIYGYNLTYEFTQLFHDLEPFVRLADDFIVPYHYNEPNEQAGDYTIRAANNKRHFVTIRNDATHVTVKLYDASSFFTTSLENAARSVGIVGKLDKPPVFSRRQARTKAFQAYARRDAYITRRLGEKIIDWHEQYDVRTCISAPHFAASVFRRRFLTGPIPVARPRELEQYGLYSYHGGKNGYYRDGPQEIADVWNLDIRSAYPEAMRQLPDVQEAVWRHVDGYQSSSPGVWRIIADYRRCPFRGMQTIAGSWDVPSGRIEPAYLTSYEIDAMLARGELTIHEADGWVCEGPSGGPLVAYVDRFYDQKRNASDDTLRLLAKLLLNSLYGKFFQKTPLGDAGIGVIGPDNELTWQLTNSEGRYDYKAGGLYHPPFASLITGFVRAKMHNLEHTYGAIMTSTDGLFSTRAPDPTDLGTDLWMLDATHGRLRIWRERLYLFDDDDGKQKAALHGFRGKADDLARIPLTRGRYAYDAQQVVTLALSTRLLDGTQYEPGTFVRLPFVLDLDRAAGVQSA
jgi:DNA polymerase type B, organellar and viral